MSKTKHKSVKKTAKLIKNSKYQTIAAVVVIVVAAALGYFLFIASHAAAPFTSVEAENGTLTGSGNNAATKITGDSAASGSAYVRFGSSPGYNIPTCNAYCGGTSYGPGTTTTITVKDKLNFGRTVWIYRPPVPDSASL